MIQPRTRREQLLVDAIVDHRIPPSELAPRTAREKQIVREAVRDAEQIRAARTQMRDRIILISPHYSEDKKRAALRRLQEGGQANG